MQSQQPDLGYGPNFPTPSATGPEQYDFIMKSGGSAGGSQLRLPGGGSMTARLVAATGGGLVLLLIGWALFSILSRPTGLNVKSLTALARQQTELARISQQPAQLASAESTRNFAATTRLSFLSEQQVFINFLRQRHSKVNQSAIQATQNAQTDAALRDALTNGTYDQTYLAITASEIAAYERALKQAYFLSKDQGEKVLLNAAYGRAQLLLQQAPK